MTEFMYIPIKGREYLINWYYLSRNPNAIPILEKNMDKIDNFIFICKNPNALHLLFTYDFPEMKKTREQLNREIIEYVFHPLRLNRLVDVYNMNIDTYLEII